MWLFMAGNIENKGGGGVCVCVFSVCMWHFCNSSSSHGQTLKTNQKEEPNVLT